MAHMLLFKQRHSCARVLLYVKVKIMWCEKQHTLFVLMRLQGHMLVIKWMHL